MEQGTEICCDGDLTGFHRNQAISAVQDEDQFYGEDEDYEDLFNDLNIGEGFIQSLHRNDEAVAFSRENDKRNEPPRPPPPPVAEALPEKVQIPGISGETKPSDFPEVGFRGNSESVAPVRVTAPPGGTRFDLGPSSCNIGEVQRQNGTRSYRNEGFSRQGGVVVVGGNSNGSSGGNGGTTLFVGELHWWTTDEDLEAELCKYGQVKVVQFFVEKTSGKSKGYCKVEFYGPMVAAECQEGMNGHMFNGRPCVVAFASPYTIHRMDEAQMNKNQAMKQSQAAQRRRGRGIMGNRGQMGGSGRGIMGNGGIVAPPMLVLHPGNMLSQGFDPTGYGAAMGRIGGGYGGFPAAPFPGMVRSFPPVVAPPCKPSSLWEGDAYRQNGDVVGCCIRPPIWRSKPCEGSGF